MEKLKQQQLRTTTTTQRHASAFPHSVIQSTTMMCNTLLLLKRLSKLHNNLHSSHLIPINRLRRVREHSQLLLEGREASLCASGDFLQATPSGDPMETGWANRLPNRSWMVDPPKESGGSCWVGKGFSSKGVGPKQAKLAPVSRSSDISVEQKSLNILFLL